MMKLLLASNNLGKLAEFKSLLIGYIPDLLTPDDLGMHLDVEESGETYAHNASFKARAFAQASGLITLADDSGLEVDVLDGLPGIRSARFTPNLDSNDADRRGYLLSRLDKSRRPWKAKFVCTLAIGELEGDVKIFVGECQGEIVPLEKGEFGFGYDPIFLIPHLQKTMAELSVEEKNQISHRARAVKAALPSLVNLLSAVP
jgi:XTP/dITP diphosphohydrolase